jgi:hypothetical protein
MIVPIIAQPVSFTLPPIRGDASKVFPWREARILDSNVGAIDIAEALGISALRLQPARCSRGCPVSCRVFRFLVTALFCDDRKFAIRFLDRARRRIFKPDL